VTIGLGVLCSSGPDLAEGTRPDTIIMASDTLGSTDHDSTAELRKTFIVPEAKLYAVCAGKV
jgi:hypothetical protein